MLRNRTAPTLILPLFLATVILACSPSSTLPLTPAPTLPLQSPPATATAIPQPTPAFTPTPPPCRLSQQAPITTSEVPKGTILFVQGNHSAQGNYVPQLWAISPYGQRVGMLTHDEEGIAVGSPESPPPDLIIASITPFYLDSPRLQFVLLPPECTPPPTESSDWEPCSDFRFSRDGTRFGFLWGHDPYARKGVIVIEPSSGKTWRWTLRNVYWFLFLTDDHILASSGHPEGGGLSVWNLQTGKEQGLGGGQELIWNPSRTATAGESGAYGAWESTIWVYNLATGDYFYSQEGMNRMDENLLWTPDGTQVFYHHRVISYTEDRGLPKTLGPREIRTLDATSGETRLLIGDPQHSYHLCDSPQNCHWRGDWILVRRVPFQPRQYMLYGSDYPDFSDPEIACAWYGLNCVVPADQLALNWKTGEWLPWEEAPLPTPEPTPPPATPWPTAGPDLAGEPIYIDPEGRYRLYTGASGWDLWCVPTTGEPVRWVDRGYHFIYIP